MRKIFLLVASILRTILKKRWCPLYNRVYNTFMRNMQSIYFDFASRERGNALFLILIAVALFAALSYAITQGTRGSGGTITRENTLITAGQVVEQQAPIRAAVARMIITGMPINTITFDSGTSHSVFDPVGGGGTGLPPPSTACSPACTAWTYVPITSKTSGSYVYSVGSTDTEALAYLPSLTQEVCVQIQKGLGLGTAVAQQATAAYTGVAGAYDAAGSATTIKSADASLDGQEFSCWNNSVAFDASKNTYFHVIYAQ